MVTPNPRSPITKKYQALPACTTSMFMFRGVGAWEPRDKGTKIDLPLHWSNMTSLYFHSSKLCVRNVVILRCSVALLKICFGTETVAEGEVSCEAPPPLHPLPVLLTLAGEGSGEKL